MNETSHGKVLRGDIVQPTNGDTAPMNTAATAEMVNRTHRVVRERAAAINEQKRRMRSLSIPMLICAGLVAALVCAFWSSLDEYDLISTGLPDASQQMLVLSLWFLPLSGLLLGVAWFRRNLATRDGHLK